MLSGQEMAEYFIHSFVTIIRRYNIRHVTYQLNELLTVTHFSDVDTLQGKHLTWSHSKGPGILRKYIQCRMISLEAWDKITDNVASSIIVVVIFCHFDWTKPIIWRILCWLDNFPKIISRFIVNCYRIMDWMVFSCEI